MAIGGLTTVGKMTKRPWWQGEESVFNEAAMDFILAAKGLEQSFARLDGNADDPYAVIECAWWIGAATEACGRRHSGTILEGFYWVRNKGFHETAKALGSITPPVPPALLGQFVLGKSRLGDPFGEPAMWERLDGLADGSRAAYNKHLAGQDVLETITAARTELLMIFQKMRDESGVEKL